MLMPFLSQHNRCSRNQNERLCRGRWNGTPGVRLRSSQDMSSFQSSSLLPVLDIWDLLFLLLSNDQCWHKAKLLGGLENSPNSIHVVLLSVPSLPSGSLSLPQYLCQRHRFLSAYSSSAAQGKWSAVPWLGGKSSLSAPTGNFGQWSS